jgi:hypothetical protein
VWKCVLLTTKFHIHKKKSQTVEILQSIPMTILILFLSADFSSVAVAFQPTFVCAYVSIYMYIYIYNFPLCAISPSI